MAITRKLKVGDTVYVPASWNRGRRAGALMAVSKVGRVWIEVGGHAWDRHRVTTLYDSAEAYQSVLDREAEWSRLRIAINRIHGAPDGVTLESIAAVRRTLGLGDA